MSQNMGIVLRPSKTEGYFERVGLMSVDRNILESDEREKMKVL